MSNTEEIIKKAIQLIDGEDANYDTIIEASQLLKSLISKMERREWDAERQIMARQLNEQWSEIESLKSNLYSKED